MESIKNYIKDNKMMVILLSISCLLFILLSIMVTTKNTNYIDSLVHAYILDIRNARLTSVLTLITNLAGGSFLLAISVILLIVMKNKNVSIYILINLIMAFLINEITKAIFVRSRPIGINLIDETGFSFPSGHSMVSLSFYGLIAYFLFKNAKNKIDRTMIVLGLIILVLMIGFSRIYLGVHYISDVIGGFLLSIIYLTIFINIIIKLEKK